MRPSGQTLRTPNQLLRHGHWNVGVVDRPVSALLESPAPLSPQWFPARRDRFLADPFAAQVDGHWHVFCEMYPYGVERGVIAHLELGPGGPTEPQVVLDLDVHLSYPFVLEHEGEVMLVPETAGAREVGLYAAEAFPRGWRKRATLLSDVAVLDPTLFRHEGLWWLFATDAAGAHSRLCAWYAEYLLGPWRPHRQNPVKVDLASARPAGAPFEHSGQLYRPAQDCSVTYGGGLVLNRVVRLSPDEFAEEEVASIGPDPDGPYPLGIHTLSSLGDVTLVDGKRMVRRTPTALCRALARRVRQRGLSASTR